MKTTRETPRVNLHATTIDGKPLDPKKVEVKTVIKEDIKNVSK